MTSVPHRVLITHQHTHPPPNKGGAAAPLNSWFGATRVFVMLSMNDDTIIQKILLQAVIHPLVTNSDSLLVIFLLLLIFS